MGFGGRPPIYNSVEELQQKIDAYFNGEMRHRTIYTKEGVAIEVPTPTVTGLAIHLGFESRQSFYDYEKVEQFSYTIKKARLFIEREYEELLQSGNTTGAIFALKNMGWVDKVHNDVTTNEKDITPTITPEIISKLIDKL